MRTDLLFYLEGSLSDFLQQRKNDIKDEIEGYDSDYILNASEEDLYQYLISKYSLEVPIIQENRISVYKPKDIKIDVSMDPGRDIFDRSSPFYVNGTQVLISAPFKGDRILFYYQPSTFTLNPPRGKIVGQEIYLIYEMVESNKKNLNQMYKKNLGSIKKYLQYVEKDIKDFNNSLALFVKQNVTQRKKKLLDDLNLVSALEIPIKHDENLPKTYTIPSINKKLKFEPPIVTKGPFKPEPTLSKKEYENILEVVYDMALVIERNPQTFSELNEEGIRNLFLMMLNSHFKGQATGETFNYKGKTDILIRYEGKNAFIAECKFWRGKKRLIDAIDQLLKYISWRDTKTAILIFNKNIDFSTVLEKIDPILKSHYCCKRNNILINDKLKNETIFSYVFHHPNDVNREIILTILTFNILT